MKIDTKKFLALTITYFLPIIQLGAHEYQKYSQDSPNGLGIVHKTTLGDVFHYFCPNTDGDIILGESIEYLTLNNQIILKSTSISCKKNKKIYLCAMLAQEGRL